MSFRLQAYNSENGALVVVFCLLGQELVYYGPVKVTAVMDEIVEQFVLHVTGIKDAAYERHKMGWLGSLERQMYLDILEWLTDLLCK
jgi:hypothetical protein